MNEQTFPAPPLAPKEGQKEKSSLPAHSFDVISSQRRNTLLEKGHFSDLTNDELHQFHAILSITEKKMLESMPDTSRQGLLEVLYDHHRSSAILSKKVSRLQEETDRLKERIKKFEIDGTTGLHVKNIFFERLSGELDAWASHALADENNSKPGMSFDCLLKRVMDPQHPFSLDNAPPLYLISIDIAYLSYANLVAGHACGDNLLESVGKIFLVEIEKSPQNFMVCRVGGDELLGMSTLPLSDLEKLLQRIRENLKRKIITPTGGIRDDKRETGGGYTTPPPHEGQPLHIDIGISHITESLRALREISHLPVPADNQHSDSKETSPKTVGQAMIIVGRESKFFTNLWENIADRRLTYDKAVTRITYLCTLRKNFPEVFTHIINTFRKGGLNITDDTLDSINNIDTEEGRAAAVEAYVHDYFTSKSGVEFSSDAIGQLETIFSNDAVREPVKKILSDVSFAPLSISNNRKI